VGTLLVAAGGGGDAIAAAVLATATNTSAVGIATLAWDRLIVDPLPGPRSVTDFTDLEAHDGYFMVTSDSRPIPPAGSTLPRLAAELPLPLVLLDPTDGAVGLRCQIAAATEGLGAKAIRLVDVGGDILGRPGDEGLRSPLADALTAASCLGLPTTVWLAGPGLDGELAEGLVVERIGDRLPLLTLDATAWPAFLPILEWHPSEATALLAAASFGLRGRVEIRDAGLPVQLTDNSTAVYELPLAAVAAINPLAGALVDSTSLVVVEGIIRGVLGHTELDVERTKAEKMRRPENTPLDLEAALAQWEAGARARGVEYVTFRRLAEELGHRNVTELRSRLMPLASSCPPLVWRIRA
jgi:hypothetical protein